MSQFKKILFISCLFVLGANQAQAGKTEFAVGAATSFAAAPAVVRATGQVAQTAMTSVPGMLTPAVVRRVKVTMLVDMTVSAAFLAGIAVKDLYNGSQDLSNATFEPTC